MTEEEKDLVTSPDKPIDPKDYEPNRRNYATPEDKRALGIGALLFAGAAAGFLFLTASGAALRSVLKSRK